MYSQIIPNNYQEELIQIGEDITRHTFRIGDIVLEVQSFVQANKMECTKRDIWRAVGSFIGKSAATVQRYESLAAFYSLAVRKRYEVLSSSHFRIAMQIHGKGEHKWHEVLEYAVDRVEDYGRPATVDELVKVFVYNSEPFEFDDESLEPFDGNPINVFIDHLSELKRNAELLPLPEEKRRDLRTMLDGVENIVNSLLVLV